MADVYEELPFPWDHQGEGVSLLTGGSSALWLDPRLGKTRIAGEALRLLEGLERVAQVVVVCPVNAKEVWAHWLRTMMPHWPAEKLQGLTPVYLAASTRALIVNPDVLDAQGRAGKGYQGWAGTVVQWMGERPTVLVLDECHKYASNPNSGEYKAVQRLALCAERVWELTGTFYESSALDAHWQLRMLGPRYPFYWTKRETYGERFCERKWNGFRGYLKEGVRKDGTRYKYRSGGYDYSGLKDGAERELVHALEGVVLRRRRDECLDVPDVRWLPVWVDHLDQQVSLRRDEMAALRSELVLIKAQRTIEFVQELRERPVIVYGHHRAFCRNVANHFRAPLIYGATGEQERVRVQAEFMEGRHPVLVANLALDAIDLSMACDDVYGELDWSATKLRQSSDRKINGMDKREKRSHVLLVSGSVEEEVWNRILLKGQAMERLDLAARALRELGLSLAELG